MSDTTTESGLLANFANFFLHVHPVKVDRKTPRPLFTLGLRLMAFFLFLILVGTGMLLMYYYVASTTQAFAPPAGARHGGDGVSELCRLSAAILPTARVPGRVAGHFRGAVRKTHDLLRAACSIARA